MPILNEVSKEQDQLLHTISKPQKAPRSCLKKAIEGLVNIVIQRDVEGEEDPNRKRVRFAEKLDNDQSLDSQDRERIEHNLKYNDDTIFDNISIFRDLNNSGLIIHPKIKDKKDVHPLKLKLPVVVDDDEEQDKDVKEDSLVHQIGDPSIKEFWGIEPIPKQAAPHTSVADNSGVSPIQTRKPNNSS